MVKNNKKTKAMKFQDLLVKKQWSRRVRTQGSQAYISKSPAEKIPMNGPSGSYMSFSQDKFLDEIHSGAHVIYDNIYRSMRPKFKYDEETRKHILDGYEDVTRSAVSWQEAIRGNKAAICGGNAPQISNAGEESDEDKINIVKRMCDELNLQGAIMMMFYSMFGTGDGALYFYINPKTKKIEWKCFTYEDGDNCNEVPDYEDPKTKMGARVFQYDYQGIQVPAVELYREKTIELWIQWNEKDNGKINSIKHTEDGYHLIESISHNMDESPLCYARINDIPSGPVQKNIEDYEKLLSDTGENVKYYAFQILFLSGGAIALPNANFGGKVIGSKTADGDAKILEPADASNTLDIDFRKTYNAICDGSKTVFIKPEDLKGQNDSGAYIANLYFPELQWAAIFYPKFHNTMSKILRIIAKLTGEIEGNIVAYQNLRFKYKMIPFIPQNKLEKNTMLQTGVQSGYLSRRTAAEENELSNPMEISRLNSEENERKKAEMKEKQEKNLL